MSGAARVSGIEAWCVRCHAELPARTEESTLYCPHCGAVQLVLPDYLRVVTPEMEEQRTRTTGMVPPPRPQMVDWRAAIRCAGVVGTVAAVLMGLGLLLPVMDSMGTLWMLASGLTAVWLYGRVRPRMRMDARTGVRIGVVAGLVTVSLVGVVLAAGGLVNRFALNRGAALDEFVTEGLGVTVNALKNQPGNPAFNTQALDVLESPEGRAGYMLLNLVFDGAFLIGLAAASGAATGSMARRRSRVGDVL